MTKVISSPAGYVVWATDRNHLINPEKEKKEVAGGRSPECRDIHEKKKFAFIYVRTRRRTVASAASVLPCVSVQYVLEDV
jgi:hypothetical protein